jgi:predicted RNA-binding protein with PIN domain
LPRSFSLMIVSCPRLHRGQYPARDRARVACVTCPAGHRGRAPPWQDRGVLRVLVVDGANVVGSRPDGWWRDRAGAAARLHGRLAVADTSYDEIVLVLEGQAKAGVPRGRDGHLRTVHAGKDGDATIIAETRTARDRDQEVVVITADRALAQRVESFGARTMSPSWLLAVLDA